ncbi:TPA: hypothetical protein ACUM1S_001119, partial [Haemophilus influenzae]
FCLLEVLKKLAFPCLRGKVPKGRKRDIGICEIKFWSDEILKNIDNVPKTIYVEIEHLSPLSLRQFLL